MNKCQLFLTPANINNFSFTDKQIGGSIRIYKNADQFPDINGTNIAILGITDQRGNPNLTPEGNAPDIIRKHLYSLYNHHSNIVISDIGNIKTGQELKDTYYALKKVVNFLISNNIFTIILGGSNDFVFCNYLAYEKLNKLVNITSIDSKFDLSENMSKNNSSSFLSKIIMHKPNFLFNYTNIGYQSYYNDINVIQSMDKLYFDVFRYGIVKNNLMEIEPSIRNSDLISFDLSAVKHSDAPGCVSNGPNGLSGDEFCTIAFYAGSSEKVSSLGFYEYSPENDCHFQTAELIAQAIWYIIDGYSNRFYENPRINIDNMTKYYVKSKDFSNTIVFYQSNITNRWWMEVDCPDELKEKYDSSYFIPCSYADYTQACQDKIPNRWIQCFKKFL